MLSHFSQVQSCVTHGLQPTRLLCQWDFPGKNAGVGYRAIHQGIFPTQGWNPCSCIAGRFFTTGPPGNPEQNHEFSRSVMSDCATPWTAALQASLSITNSQSLLKLMYIESVMPSNHLILCCPLLFLPSIFPSIRVFSNESVLHIRWPNIGVSASASVLPMNIHD